MSLNIFLIYNIYYLCCTCIVFDDLSAWAGCWFVVYIRGFIDKFLNACPFDYTAVAEIGKVGPVNLLTKPVAVVTPTARPKSVRNRCGIELFCGVVCVVTLPFWHFCWCRRFCYRTESDLFIFFIPHECATSVPYYIARTLNARIFEFVWATVYLQFQYKYIQWGIFYHFK